MSPRLLTYLTGLLGPAALAGCTGVKGTTPTGDTGTPPLTDVACLDVPIGDACPSEDDARVALIGTQTCESPVREVIATGAFLSESDVLYTLYGGYSTTWDSSDTGIAETRCCYEAAYLVHEDQSCTIGRPLMVDGRMVSARRVTRADWARAPRPDVTGLSDEARARLADEWTRAGLLEHASIPAFARVALDLAALGAPPELLARTAAAMQDEVAHAEACFALASAYARRPVGPGPLPVTRGRRPSLRRLAVEAFREGCVGETLAVGLAAEQLRDATDPAVRRVLQRIVADEARHAELAWDIVRWAIARGGSAVRRAIADEAATLERAEGPDVVRGLVDAVILPTASELLAA